MYSLDKLEVYQEAMNVGEKIWQIVDKWNFFSKDTMGKQVVKSADSIAANISEGYGRYHYRESIVFYYYSRGSLMETITWVTKAKNRNMIPEQVFSELSIQLETLNKKLNGYINYVESLKTSDKIK